MTEFEVFFICFIAFAIPAAIWCIAIVYTAYRAEVEWYRRWPPEDGWPTP